MRKPSAHEPEAPSGSNRLQFRWRWLIAIGFIMALAALAALLN